MLHYMSNILFVVALFLPHVVFYTTAKKMNQEWYERCRNCLDLADYYRNRANQLEERLNQIATDER